MEKYILVTGCAGFIGFQLSKRLLNQGERVLGIDNINDYYDTKLKYDRLTILESNENFRFVKGSIENLDILENLFNQFEIEIVIHLAAQAGVRYSLTNPHAYVQSNLVGFANILECCKNYNIKHLIFASSSSVYGNNKQIPFSTNDRVDQPISLYAATKKANELMAYTYSYLYKLPATGLRFFTVYGPWGRPDMAIFTFTNAIFKEQPLNLFNYGNMKRDFTYIDDVIDSIILLIEKSPSLETTPPYKIFNIGNHQPIELHYFIQILEEQIGKKAITNLLPIQPGDVTETFADIEDLVRTINYRPMTKIEDGVSKYVKWFKDYYNIS